MFDVRVVGVVVAAVDLCAQETSVTALPLVRLVALVLSALNAITGTARALHQMSVDGQFPRFFQKTNRHGVPGHSMAFNVLVMIAVVFMGGAVEIYTFSNVGYLAS